MATRCKMTLAAVVPKMWGGVKAIYNCVYDPQIIAEDAGFSKATPNGMAEFDIDNPKAIEQLVIGEAYYFDITMVPKPEPVAAG